MKSEIFEKALPMGGVLLSKFQLLKMGLVAESLVLCTLDGGYASDIKGA